MIGEDGVRESVNSFGDRAHLCDAANKTTHHKHARVTAKKMVAAIAFAADNEVVGCAIGKHSSDTTPEVERVDPTGELLNIYLAITLPT